MAKRKGPKKTNRYPDEFKIKAVSRRRCTGPLQISAITNSYQVSNFSEILYYHITIQA